MAFNLGSFQTFGERLGRIEALKKAWQVANVSPLDIPGVRGAVKKALPKPLEGPAQFALGQFNPLNAGLIAAGILVPPLGVMGAAGRSASIGARIAPELRVAGTSLLGAYGGQQAGQLAERELGIPGAGLVGSLAGGVGGAAYGIKAFGRPPTGLVEPVAEVAQQYLPKTRPSVWTSQRIAGRSVLPRTLVKSPLETFTEWISARFPEDMPPKEFPYKYREPLHGEPRALLSRTQGVRQEHAGLLASRTYVKKVMDVLGDEIQYYSFRPTKVGILPTTMSDTMAMWTNQGNHDQVFFELWNMLAEARHYPISAGASPGFLRRDVIGKLTSLIAKDVIHEPVHMLAAHSITGRGAADVAYRTAWEWAINKTWNKVPRTHKRIDKALRSLTDEEWNDYIADARYIAPTGENLNDLYRGGPEGADAAISRQLSALQRFGGKGAIPDALREWIPAGKAPVAPGAVRGNARKLRSLNDQWAKAARAVSARMDELGVPLSPTAEEIDDALRDPKLRALMRRHEAISAQLDKLEPGARLSSESIDESAFTNQPSSELFKARGLRDDALARAKALGFDPRSPRKPGETPDMAALRDEFHNANKQVGELQRQMAVVPAAEIMPSTTSIRNIVNQFIGRKAASSTIRYNDFIKSLEEAQSRLAANPDIAMSTGSIPIAQLIHRMKIKVPESFYEPGGGFDALSEAVLGPSALHKLNKAYRGAAELPPEFKLAGDESAFTNADALIAEGDALMAEGRNARAAEKYREALGMVQGGGEPPRPPTIEGPGTFGEGFELGPGGGPPPGGTQPPIGAGFEPPPKPLDIGEEIAAAANVPRVLLVSSLDMSATARQLFPAWAGKPSLLPQIIARQAKSMVDPESSAAFNRALLADHNIQFGMANGLDIVTAGTGATAEEAFQVARGAKVHQFLEKIPWIRATERAYTDAVNLARSTLFKDTIKNWSQEWMADPSKVRRLTGFINELTGRGDLKALNKYGPFLNSVLFSPRLLISRLKLPFRAVDLARPEMRGIVFKHLAGTFGSIAAFAAMLTAVGITVEMDPRSANFMKARMGNMRVDLTGGFGPVYRYMAQIATGQRKTEAGDIIPAPRADSVMRFLRSKMSPVAGLGSDIISGETFEGREITATGATAQEQLWNNLTPLVTQDIRDALVNEGFLAGVGAGVGSFLGVSVQTYPETPQAKLKARFQEKYGREYQAGIDNVLVETDPELSALAEESQKYRLERGGEGAIAKEKRTREFAQKEQDFNLPMLAEGVLSGDPAAGSQFVEQFERYQQNIADVIYHEFFEDELDVGDTALARDFDTWRKVTPEQYRDPATFEIDWETYSRIKDAAFARLPEEYRNAIEVRTRSQDSTVKQVETKFKQARTLRRQYFDLPKWVPQVGSTTDQDQIQEIQEAAQVANRQLASQGYTDVGMDTVYGLVAKTGQYGPRLVGLAFALRSGTKESQLYANPARQEFLLKNVSLLQLFYPDMYRNEQLLAQIGTQDGRNAPQAFAS